jgi:hypothetical protein
LEWLVNGYQTVDTVAARLNTALASAGQTVDALKALTDFEIGSIKFPETKIGEAVTQAADWLSEKMRELESKQPPPTEQPAVPPKIPLVRATAAAWRRERQRAKTVARPETPSPEPARPKLRFRKGPQ